MPKRKNAEDVEIAEAFLEDDVVDFKESEKVELEIPGEPNENPEAIELMFLPIREEEPEPESQPVTRVVAPPAAPPEPPKPVEVTVGHDECVAWLENSYMRLQEKFDLVLFRGGDLPDDKLSFAALLFMQAVKPGGKFVTLNILRDLAVFQGVEFIDGDDGLLSFTK